MSLYTLLASGCQFEGWLKVVEFDSSGNEKVFFEGVGDELCYPYEDWADKPINWIYHNRYENCLCIELG
jgi:hypothetical protein